MLRYSIVKSDIFWNNSLFNAYNTKKKILQPYKVIYDDIFYVCKNKIEQRK